MAVDGVLPSRQYLLWYYQWAHMILIGRGYPSMPAHGVVPDFALDGLPDAPDMVQPEDGELPAVHPRVPKRRRPPAGRGRGRHAPTGSPAREEAPQQGVDADRSQDFEFGMTDADFLSLGLAGPSHTTPDTQAGTSQSQPPKMQLQIEAPQPWFPNQFASPQGYQPQPITAGVNHIPDSYSQWCANMYGRSSYQPLPDHYSWGTRTQSTEPFAHMSESVPPSAYEPRRTEVEESDDSGDRHMVREDIADGLDRDQREIRPPPCGTGGCLDARAGRRGRGRRGP
ncbi:hypothetical protein PIB30_038578 [Stylosanthes scabra]|uniref:Uncharacterized protein n=1 Tax=Stylosanthes scabra TaxID=79078 RepID=A0ABU6ZCI1_9FABA|nr:hypothetical protein [Stylosanthes scabra]